MILESATAYDALADRRVPSIRAKEGRPLRVLMVTSEWPTAERPSDVPYLVEQVQDLRRVGAEVELFAFRGGARPSRYLEAWRRLRRQYDLRRFDVVHAQFGQSAVVAWPCPAPLVVTFHGSDLAGLVSADGRYTARGWLLRAISRWAARRASRVILVSRSLAQFLPHSVPHELVPCGVDLERFVPQPKHRARAILGLPADRRLVLFAADPANPIKRFGLARQAVAALSENLAAELLVLNGAPPAQVPLFMSAADALILTSTHEGSPMVVKEALACNLPVVSVSVGDVAERIQGVAGCVLCTDDSARALAAALEIVLAEPTRAQGRESVVDLDGSRVAERILSVYRSVLEPRAA